MSNFTEIVRFISNGEQVEAGVTNQPMRTIDQNTRYLKEVLDNLVRGENIIARNQVVDSAVLKGQPVYFDRTTQSFKQALGNVELDADTGSFETSASSQVWGICNEKHTSTNADILLHGITRIDLSNAVDGDVDPGLYYLSNQTAGKLTLHRPPVGISVVLVGSVTEDNENLVYVNTQFHDLLEAHKHYKFELLSFPAGDTAPPVEGERHTISNADNAIEGWLPADDEIFEDKAPEGAKFGYNISESALSQLWPPMPLEGCFLELYPGGEELGSAVPSGAGELVVFDRNGIWWMSDCYGHAPWDTALDTTTIDGDSLSECPLHGDRHLILWFTRPSFANNGTWVSSLQTRDGSGLVLTCVDNGEAATTGHLLLDLDLDLTVGDSDADGHIVFKELANKKFQLGPVVESITAGSSNVKLLSNVSAQSGKYFGNVTVSVDQDLSAGELGIDLARQDGIEEIYYANVIGLGFLANRLSSFRGRFTVPVGITLPSGTKVKLVFWILNRSSVDIPAEVFDLSYRRIPIPADGPTPLPLNDAEVTLPSIPTSNIEVDGEANMYTIMESEPFEVQPGDELLFDLIRDGVSGVTAGFTGDLVLIRQYGLYVAP